MSDVERLFDWLAQHEMTLYKLAQILGKNYSYNTLYIMAVKGKRVSDRFIVEFIRHYGCEEATRIFANRLRPVESQQ